MIKRQIYDQIKAKLFKQKAIIISGARQVGKTTLLRMFMDEFKNEALYLNCDEFDVREILRDANSSKLKSIFGEKKLILIDEAQRVENIGLTIKIIVDNLSQYQVIATSSSAIGLIEEVSEPLTGRKYDFVLFPISWKEYVNHIGYLEANRDLENRLIYGMYPEIIMKKDEQRELIKSITQSYLFKDIFTYKDLKKPEILEKLVKALALQIGNLVSYYEISQLLKVDAETIQRYIEILEKSFVIFRLPSFQKNMRNELSKSRKIYFYDLGVRNAVINNFLPINRRTDFGAMWENFLIVERMKNNFNSNITFNAFFWRTHQKQEIDYIEEQEGKLMAFEFSFTPNPKKKIPKTFKENYPDAKTLIVDKSNFDIFLDIR
ncbi:MAG: ATP-binding protein [Ignavibacteria bacterium]|jgi:predicted AAA+ superfamily ATPase|nr:ATP-binding protein [Ignavibacteria bacterium]MDH7527900.1 ATP-binding protein [Ignavibacteria bacterium]